MFGYHDNDRCGFDIWSPVEERRVCGTTESSYYSALYGRESHCAIENRAFSPYCKHTTEVEQIINQLYSAALQGITSVSIETDEFLSEEDWEYIRNEVQRRL